jgi:ABC transporter DrrB family efflux protein
MATAKSPTPPEENGNQPMTVITESASRSAVIAEAIPPASGANVLATISTVAGRSVRRYMRTPQLLMSSIVGVATFMVLFRYIFGGSIHLQSVPYVEFMVPGFVLTSVLIAGTGIAVGIAEHRELGSFDRLRSLPVSRVALASGQALGETAIVAWGVAFTAALGFAFGFRFHGSVGQALFAYVLCVICGFAFVWIFVGMGLAAKNGQSAQGMSMAVYPLLFVSSAYVPAHNLPGWMQPIADHQPITIMSNAVRSLALGSPRAAGLSHSTAYWVVLSLAWVAGLVVVFAPLVLRGYSKSS